MVGGVVHVCISVFFFLLKKFAKKAVLSNMK